MYILNLCQNCDGICEAENNTFITLASSEISARRKKNNDNMKTNMLFQILYKQNSSLTCEIIGRNITTVCTSLCLLLLTTGVVDFDFSSSISVIL